MKALKIFLISIVAIILIFSIVFFFAKDILLSKIQSTIIKKIEVAIDRKIDVGGIMFLPHKGLALKNLRIYKEGEPENAISIKSLFTNVNLAHFFKSKEIIATVLVEGAKFGNINAGGVLSFESQTFKKILKPFDNFALKSLNIKRIDLDSPYISVDGISGIVTFDKENNNVKAPEVRFNYQNNIYRLSLDGRDIKTRPDITMNIKGADIEASGRIRNAENELYIIEKSSLRFRDTYFECEGEINNLKNPVLLLTGNLSLNTKDIASVGPKLRKVAEKLNPAGIVDTEFYFRGPIMNLSKWQAGLKSRSRGIKAANLALDDITLNIKMENGVLSIPIFTAYPYGGVLNSSLRMELTERGVPYSFHMLIKNMDINGVAQHSQLKNSKLSGMLDTEVVIDGYMADQRTMLGKGYIYVHDANLGPMPLLSPLVGNIYGMIRGMLPELQNVDIRGGSCDFIIKDRKVATNNLVLWGNAMNIKARGYIDFDKNLNFEVENELKEVDEETPEGWRGTILKMMAGVGKMIGKAYLTGTLDKPKWEFEYLGAAKNALGGQLQGVFKDLF